MEKMMKQLGIKTEELDAKDVRITTKDGVVVLKNPKISIMNMRGQKIFQIIPEEIVEEQESTNDEDIELIMSQTNCSKEEAEKALKESNGDIAEAILKIKG